MAKVCERITHRRIAWAMAALFFLGGATGQVLAGGHWETAMLPAIAGFLCLGFYSGVLKLDPPRKKANPSGSVEPTPASPK